VERLQAGILDLLQEPLGAVGGGFGLQNNDHGRVNLPVGLEGSGRSGFVTKTKPAG
jgi:hypothetical protein